MAPLLRQRTVMGGHDVVAQLLTELMCQPLGQAARVDEYDRGAVLAHQLSDALDDVAHLFGRRQRLELALWQFDPEIELAPVSDVDDRTRLGCTGAAQQV